MSWSLYVVPVGGLSRDGLAEWLASADFIRDMPEQTSPFLRRPSIAEVLAAFRVAGCHGTNWFEVVGEPAGSRLPECPGTDVCTSSGALDLGEVSVRTVGRSSSVPAVTADAIVETVTFPEAETRCGTESRVCPGVDRGPAAGVRRICRCSVRRAAR